MDQPTWERAKEIFSEAVEKPASQRSVFLDSACGEDAEIRAQVDALLKAHDEAGGFLASPTLTPADQVTITGLKREPASAEESPGTRIGPYKLLQRIGEGGFGTVFMAEQVEPIHRKVALKIIKLGMDTKQVIARFEAERQALAMMDHPHIARVFDAGDTATGRPYFVMELVKGVPITEYCDANNLSTRERLDLFTLVCQAVQHAHQKGIIHRDIKPSNVMVTLHDGIPVPKVIDFGIAKATHARLTERTLFTEHHQLIGTPAYMSPEQAEMSGLDVDTRTDIYSLGVLLYELLTGTTPFDPRSLREAAYGELQRIIREVEPPKPSTRLSTLGDQVADIARHHNAEPKTLSRLVRGDLDWIVMKALAKDRMRRYVTPAEFSDDISRHLAHEPVIAGPPSVGYRAGKFLRKHRAAVVVMSFFLVVVVVFAASMWRLAISEAAEKERAVALLNIVNFAAARNAEEEGPMARLVEETARDAALHTHLRGNDRAGMSGFLRNVFTISNDPAQGHVPPDEQIQFASWFVLDPEGILIAVYPNTGDVVGHNFHNRDYFRQVAPLCGDPADTTTRVSDVYLSENDGRYKFAIATPLCAGDDEGAEFLGVLAASVYDASSTSAVVASRSLFRDLYFWGTVAQAPFTIFAAATIWYGIRRSINRRLESGDRA